MSRSGGLRRTLLHKATADAEVDYLIHHKGCSIPIEVKAGTFGKLKSMRYHLSTYSDIPFGIKVSTDNVASVQIGSQRIISIPIYAWPAWVARR